MKSLKEVEDMVDLSRSEIQKLEKSGLAKKPTTRNKYGYLLYDTPEIDRLWQLKFYKELGYNIPEIKKLSDGEEFDEEKLDGLIHDLKVKKEKLENLIIIAEGLKKYEVNFNFLRNSMSYTDDIPGEKILGLMAAGINVWNSNDFEKWINEQMIPTEEDLNELGVIVQAILEKGSTGADAHDIYIQDMVNNLYKMTFKWFSGSVSALWEVISSMASVMEVREFIDDTLGDGSTDFLKEAISIFCDQHLDNELDKKFNDAINNIEALGLSKHAASCKEVQDEVAIIHMFYKSIKIYKEGWDIIALRNFGELMGSPAYKNLIDDGADKGIAWFVSRAIEIYLDNLNDLNKKEAKTK